MSPYRSTSRFSFPPTRKRALQVTAVLLLAAGIVACLPRIFAPRAALLNTYDNSILYSRLPDDRAMAGSTTKILTLYTALWAVSTGWVSLSDEVAISARAQEQACTCLRDMDNNGVSDVVVGERFEFVDLLYAISVSAGEATDAVAEHVASAIYHGGQKAVTKAQSEERMREFVALANYLAVLEFGVFNTFVANVHGGDGCDFAIGCYDWNGNPCVQGATCDHGTTARDMATIWKNAAASQPLFAQILGMTSRTIPSKVHPDDFEPTNWYTISKSYWYHPALEADKNGASGMSLNSWIAQARSCGRTLIGVVLNSPFNTPNTNDGNWQGDNDLGKLFDYGFEEVCKTFLTGSLGKVPSLRAHSLAVATDGGAASAMTTGSGELQVVSWSTSDLEVDPTLVAVEIAPPVPGGPVDPEESVDAVFLTDAWLVTSAVEQGGAVRLSSWRYSAAAGAEEDPPVHAGDTIVDGPFVSTRILRLADDALVLATRDEEDLVTLQVLLADVDAFYPVAQSSAADVLYAAELELAGGQSMDPATGALGAYEVVTATRSGGELTATLWEVSTDFTTVLQHESRSLGEARNVSTVATGVDGDGGYATAATDGDGADGALRLQFWQASLAAGQLQLVEDVTGGEWGKTERQISLAPVTDAGPTAVLVTSENEQTGMLRTAVWEVVPQATTDFDMRVTHRDLVVQPAGALRSAAIPGTRRFVTAARNDAGELQAELFQLGVDG